MRSYKLFADDPIQSLSEDKLGRDKFASQIVEVLKNVSKESPSSVVSLVGDWGSGKSSVLELTKEKLDKSGWYIAEFNPWLLSDLTSLVSSFFGEVIHAIPKEKRKKKDVRKTLGSYAKLVSPLGSLASVFGVSGLDKIFNKIGAVVEGDTSLNAAKNKLSKELSELDIPILVIMDDLDRLHPDELMMVFKLVRLVGRLPNLYYLMSYDEATLLDVITGTNLAKDDERRAQDYLEKIVQVRLDLPRMISSQQDDFVNISFEQVLKNNAVTITDDEVQLFSRTYHTCIKYYLTQPRSIKRYFGQIQSLFPLVKGEVNFCDFALITFLRTFEPKAYRLIVSHKNELTGQDNGFDSWSDENNDQRKARWEKLIVDSGAKHPEGVFELLAGLFVPVKNAKDNSSYANAYSDLKDGMRVGHKYYFDRYFIYGVSANDLSDKVLDNAMKALEEGKTNKDLKTLQKTLRNSPNLVLSKLQTRQRAGTLPDEQTLMLLADFYGKTKQEDGFFASDAKWAMQDIANKLLQTVAQKNLSALIDSICKSNGGLVMVAQTFNLDVSKQEKWMKKSEAQIKTLLNSRLETISGKKLAELSDEELHIIYLHKYFVGPDATKSWLWEQIDSKGWDLLELLVRMTSEATTYGNKVKRVIGELSKDTIENYLGLEQVIEKLDDKLKKVKLNVNSDLRREAPTKPNKRAYVLNRLKYEQGQLDTN